MTTAPVLDDARDLVALRDWVNQQALVKALYLECVAIEPGEARFRFTPPDEWRNPNGSVAGAAFLAGTDYAAGMASFSVTGEHDYISTVDVGLHFLRPAVVAPLMIRALVLKPGKRLVHIQAEVRDGDDVLVATGLGSFSIARGLGASFEGGPWSDGQLT